jgi:hypothetical protein
MGIIVGSKSNVCGNNGTDKTVKGQRDLTQRGRLSCQYQQGKEQTG